MFFDRWIGALGVSLMGALAGCGGAPVDGLTGEQTFELRRGERYQIDTSNPSFQTWNTDPDGWMMRCTQYDDGVVRSWYLKEINKFDFRSSKHFCRNMGPDGELEDEYDADIHFDADGGGDWGNASIPTTKLPVGIRIRSTFPYLRDYKVSDVALLYDDAADIYQGYTGYNVTDYALDRSGETHTRACPAGMVMTGMGLETYRWFNQWEIEGVRIRCDHLEVTSSPTIVK